MHHSSSQYTLENSDGFQYRFCCWNLSTGVQSFKSSNLFTSGLCVLNCWTAKTMQPIAHEKQPTHEKQK